MNERPIVKSSIWRGMAGHGVGAASGARHLRARDLAGSDPVEHLRKFALIYGLAVWTVIGMFTMGCRTISSSPEIARSTR